jgi:hypothetical protein
MSKGKDPDPYLCLMDPGGPKCGSGSPTPYNRIEPLIAEPLMGLNLKLKKRDHLPRWPLFFADVEVEG